MNYRLGGIEFSTWIDVRKYARQLLAKGCRLLSPNEFIFARDLLQYHPYAEEIQQHGIKKIQVGIPKYGTHCCFQIVDNNGNVQDFSYKKCCATTVKNIEKARQSLEREQVLRAYRAAITPQVKESFKTFLIKECAVCRTKDNLELDHKNPSFIDMVKTFESEFNVTEYPTLDRDNRTCETYSFSIKTKSDAKFVSDWQLYHRQKAVYQLLCGKCNLAKGRRTD
jgi:5-methylcytosine-specific restriction endonuclease McrA